MKYPNLSSNLNNINVPNPIAKATIVANIKENVIYRRFKNQYS